jgi:hypothetical protein
MKRRRVAEPAANGGSVVEETEDEAHDEHPDALAARIMAEAASRALADHQDELKK